MAVLISLNDNSAGDGFLLAPLDGNYDGTVQTENRSRNSVCNGYDPGRFNGH